MTARPNRTDIDHDQAEHGAPASCTDPNGRYVSPTYRRWAEQVERAARPLADTFRLPTTAAELDAMSYADRVRVYTEDRALYDRLTGSTAA